MEKKRKPNGTPFDSERGREIGRLGGIAKHKQYKKRQAFRDVFTALLSLKIDVNNVEALNEHIKTLNIDTADFNLNEIAALAVVLNAVKGDNKAFELLRDTIGEKPIDKQELKGLEGFKVVIENAGSKNTEE